MFKGIQVSGFGRDDSEATHICIKNFIDSLLEQDPASVPFLKGVLRELKGADAQDGDIETLKEKIGNISII